LPEVNQTSIALELVRPVSLKNPVTTGFSFLYGPIDVDQLDDRDVSIK
jgi:hypothetical protein